MDEVLTGGFYCFSLTMVMVSPNNTVAKAITGLSFLPLASLLH